MKLSSLQKYILKRCAVSSAKTVSKSELVKYYDNLKSRPKPKDLVNDVAKSVERLIARDLVTGYGWKTAKKWYLTQVKLTPAGKKSARTLVGQQKLPFKK
jgi:hypothetical protein